MHNVRRVRTNVQNYDEDFILWFLPIYWNSFNYLMQRNKPIALPDDFLLKVTKFTVVPIQ